jgi:hypothetical protein
VIEYYRYDSGLCAPGTNCDFRDVISVPSGFDQAEVFLSGFQLGTEVQEDAVERITAAVQKHRYDAATGELEMSVFSRLASGMGQNYSYRVTFVLILTGATVATFTPIGGGCIGTASCSITDTLQGAVPAGMHYIGLATRNWDFGSDSGPLRINTISGHVNNVVVGATDVDIDYMFFLHDASAQNEMFAEWGAAVIAFDPAEMGQHGASLFPQYTFFGRSTPDRQGWTEHHTNPSGSPISGFLDAFEGLSLFDPSALRPQPPPWVDKPIWLIESSAEGFANYPFAPYVALTTYGIFLGTQFGNTSTAAPFAFQESRALGFLL